MDTISRESNSSYLPVAGVLVGVVALIIGVTALVKVSSSPAGATITLNGRTLGVTPTTIKLPVLESSTITITKNGYEPLTEKLLPADSGAVLSVQLRRPGR